MEMTGSSPRVDNELHEELQDFGSIFCAFYQSSCKVTLIISEYFFIFDDLTIVENIQIVSHHIGLTFGFLFEFGIQQIDFRWFLF